MKYSVYVDGAGFVKDMDIDVKSFSDFARGENSSTDAYIYANALAAAAASVRQCTSYILQHMTGSCDFDAGAIMKCVWHIDDIGFLGSAFSTSPEVEFVDNLDACVKFNYGSMEAAYNSFPQIVSIANLSKWQEKKMRLFGIVSRHSCRRGVLV